MPLAGDGTTGRQDLGVDAGLAERRERVIPEDVDASKVSAVLHRLVRRRVPDGPFTAFDSTETKLRWV